MSSATKSFGLLLKRNGTAIAEVQKVSGVGISGSTVEVTHLLSTGGFQEFLATIRQFKQINFSGNFIPQGATQSYTAGLIHDIYNGTLQAFSITFTDPGVTVWSFNAFVIDFEVTGITPEGGLGFSATLRPSGQPTLA
jgi:hypothetical protein